MTTTTMTMYTFRKKGPPIPSYTDALCVASKKLRQRSVPPPPPPKEYLPSEPQ